MCMEYLIWQVFTSGILESNQRLSSFPHFSTLRDSNVDGDCSNTFVRHIFATPFAFPNTDHAKNTA